MDFLTSTILSGAVYDIFKASISLTVDSLKEKLRGWAVDSIAPLIVDELHKLDISDEMSETLIKRKIDESPELVKILSQIKEASNVTTINQNHSGSGDNIGGNKIVYK